MGERTNQRVAVIKALAHPTRLRIAEALLAGPSCVAELHQLVDYDLSTVSKHLGVMREAGWVSCRKKGLQVFYELACPCLKDFLRCVDVLALSPEKADCC